MENGNFMSSFGTQDLYFFVLTLSALPALIAMIQRLFCFHQGAITVSRVTVYVAALSLVFKIAMIEQTRIYCGSLILNILAFCVIVIAFGLNGDKKLLEHDPWGLRIANILLSLLYVSLVIVLLTSF